MASRKILMVAFHYPPLLGSSGWLRTASFARYLPAAGWQPMVLSAHPRAYGATSNEHLAAVADIQATRAFALDSSRHLSIRGRYPLLLALPDRWVSWAPAALLAGLRIIRRERPSVLWSTFPIPSAVLIGVWLQRLSGLPWVLDLRDAMLDPDYPETRMERRVYAWLERAAVHRAATVVVTTPGAARLYRERYPELPPEHFVVLPNGYDEEAFAAAETALESKREGSPTGVRLVHSGLLSRVDRDPERFFEAVAACRRTNDLPPGLQVILRGSGDEEFYQARIDALGIGDVVTLAPAVSYQEALQEILSADGLLLFQGSTCNHAIPAKVFEYLRARRPILALTDPSGDTAQLLRELGVGRIGRLDSADDIQQQLLQFCVDIASRRPAGVDTESLQNWSRAGLARQFAALLDRLVG